MTTTELTAHQSMIIITQINKQYMVDALTYILIGKNFIDADIIKNINTPVNDQWAIRLSLYDKITHYSSSTIFYRNNYSDDVFIPALIVIKYPEILSMDFALLMQQNPGNKAILKNIALQGATDA